MTTDAIFDLASLTKPVVAIAAATESTIGDFALDAPIAHWLPELGGSRAAGATVEQLLAHRSGLLPHLELYRDLQSGRQCSLNRLLTVIANASQHSVIANAALATCAVYSDLGYILVGAALERRFAQPLDRWLSTRLPSLMHGGLASVRSWAEASSDFLNRCVPTEVIPWRGGVLQGRVHDENAWLLGGFGTCGHAGLFGTALGVAKFGAAVLDARAGRDSEATMEAVAFAVQARAGGTLGAGFDRKSDGDSTAGPHASAEAFGHLGFTGTSLWCDPEREVVTVLLTNRVCPNRRNIALRTLRPALHGSLFELAHRAQAGR